MNDQLSDQMAKAQETVDGAIPRNPTFDDIPWDFKPGESVSVQDEDDLGEEVSTHPKLKI